MKITEILEGSPGSARALASASSEAWQLVLEHAIADPHEAAPAALVEALLALDADVEAWMQRAKNRAAVIDSERFTTIAQAMRPFRAWFLAGIAASPSARSSTSARFSALLSDTGHDAFEKTRALVADLGDDAASAALLPRALMLLAQRANESGHPEDALSAATQAEARFAAARQDRRVNAARRVRGAALLRMSRFAEGFALFEAVPDAPGPFAVGEGTQVSRPIEDPREDALDELATIATWATSRTPEWVRALGGVAEAHAGTEDGSLLRARFEDALAVLAQRSDARAVQADLETVMRQATERDQMETARAAERWLPLREIAPRTLDGARLILRLGAASGAWLRVHEDGCLELARGDARRDSSRVALRRLAKDDALRAAALALWGELHRSLEPNDLTRRSPWERSYAVQAFAGAPQSFVEGYVGVEHDLGVATDIFGVRSGGDARSILQTLRGLLAFVP